MTIAIILRPGEGLGAIELALESHGYGVGVTGGLKSLREREDQRSGIAVSPTGLKAFESSTISCVAPGIPLDTRLFHLPRRLNSCAAALSLIHI